MGSCVICICSEASESTAVQTSTVYSLGYQRCESRIPSFTRRYRQLSSIFDDISSSISLRHKPIPLLLELPRVPSRRQRAQLAYQRAHSPLRLETNRLREQVEERPHDCPRDLLEELKLAMTASPEVQPSPIQVPSSPAEGQLQVDRVVMVLRDEHHAGFWAELEAAPDFTGGLVDADEDSEGAGGFWVLVLELGAGDVVDAGEGVDF